ncbi:C-X-C motif chemokine 13 [Carlito syrichta]|uniref:C-X-C motif chemokine 13 n=1 Tax=Carlito syrichta TaxID=1868482 RepID=A0A1U7U1X2_CARSF|nr:C-X-C motif chemokine 13 [Carlito syrichta]
MKSTSASLFLLLLVSSHFPVQGVLEAYNTNLKCRCIQETSSYIAPRIIERLQVLPRGNGCPKTEIIIWKKNKSIVCVTPQAKWIQKIIKNLKKNVFSTPPVPVLKRRIA